MRPASLRMPVEHEIKELLLLRVILQIEETGSPVKYKNELFPRVRWRSNAEGVDEDYLPFTLRPTLILE